MTDYAAIYRRCNKPSHDPRFYPTQQPELRNLWPADQKKFRDMVDAIKKEIQ